MGSGYAAWTQSRLLVPEGKYKVQYIADNKVQEQMVEVKKDPNLPNTSEDIKKQYDFGVKLNKDIKATTKLIEDMEKQRAALQKAIGNEKSEQKKKELIDLEDRIYQLESGLFDVLRPEQDRTILEIR